MSGIPQLYAAPACLLGKHAREYMDVEAAGIPQRLPSAASKHTRAWLCMVLTPAELDQRLPPLVLPQRSDEGHVEAQACKAGGDVAWRTARVGRPGLDLLAGNALLVRNQVFRRKMAKANVAYRSSQG